MPIDVKPTSQTISWFNDRLQEEKLVFKPPFQRNPVWADKHQAYLIDTALRGLPIPEVYIQKETTPQGKTVYAVIDGQQRLRALLGFPGGEIELMDAYSPGRGGEVWENLTDDEKTAYWNYTLVVREVVNATDPDLRDLFQRLNQNTVRLNAQEIRNARYKGDFITTVTELADQPFWAEERIVSATEIRRMLDIEYVSELLVGLMHGRQNKKQSLDAMFEKYELGIPDKQKWLKRFEEARATIEELLPDLGKTRWKGKSDFYSLFLVIDDLGQLGSIPKAKVPAASKVLRSFGGEVDKRLSKEHAQHRVSKRAAEYATAVEKAASDKDRREARHELLRELLKPFFKAA
jgi:hypothetical protein